MRASGKALPGSWTPTAIVRWRPRVRDRFPLLMIGGLLLVGSLGAFLVRGAQRSEHVDILSTFKASPRGSRAIFLLGQELGFKVERYTHDLEQLPGPGAF